MSKSDRNLIEKSHNSFEIDSHDAKDDHHNEFKGLSASHNKPESIMSSSFVNASVDLGNQQSVNDNYLAGVGLMVITTLCWSIMHIICKLIYTRTPEMSSFDTVSFMGYFLVPAYYAYAKYDRANINILSFEPSLQILLVVRVLIGVCNNFALFTGLRFVTVGKSILILSMAPLFCAIAAGIFLKEQITKTSIILTLCSFGGVYLLTLNKPEEEKDASLEIFGYIMMLTSACLYGLLFVCLRQIMLYKVHMSLSPLYIGIGNLIQTIFFLIFFPDYIHFELYDATNLGYYFIIGFTCLFGQFAWTASTKYSSASKMAPITYTENVFTLLADIIVFDYHFIFSDILGMIVIIVCLIIPIVQKLKES